PPVHPVRCPVTDTAADPARSYSYRLRPQQAPYTVVNYDETVGTTIDGKPVTALRGDTVASALLATGTRAAGNSIYLNRPRGVFSAGVEEPNSLEIGRASCRERV